MRSVYLKPFDVFEIFEKPFVIRIRTLFTDPLEWDQYEWMKTVQGKYEISVTDEQYEWLKKAKVLSDKPSSDEAEREHDAQLWKKGFEKIKPSHLELMVAQSCNMRCEYCYGTDGSYSDPGMMDEKTAFDAIDFLRDQVNQRDDEKEVGLIFFGGEPLLNYELIVKCVAYAKKIFTDKKLSFGMTTNLTLMTDEMMDFFAGEEDFSILVSFDGPREYQSRRVMNDGQDSYDVVTENIKKAIKKIDKIAARATIYADDVKEKIISEFEALGFEEYQLCGASGNLAEHIKRVDLFKDYLDRKDVLEKSVKSFVEMLKNRDAEGIRKLAKHKETEYDIRFALEQTTVPKRYVCCGSGRSMIAVAHDGNIYPCHRFVGTHERRQGNIYDGFVPGVFEKHMILENEKCAKCFAKYTCGGCCAHICSCDMPNEPPKDVPDIFNAPKEHCEFTRSKVMVKAYIDAMVNKADREWLNENKLMQRKKSKRDLPK